ncbi:hypothetical protein BGZ61DRAFT_444100 [Ilyonectria robusta]|uniref:uncharacterized protein n=1 Tax=Ilyonectria robusta TaxID=1079257 RepID=UPI001E8CE9DB|nr:uncharacterized protein BGZ61DRAFT_444100 [Ilyonectria robusta]KAH8735336.1 hypothetical protein BGZ61DRAFT_444100 [Ilyonectria robusta]
MGRPWSLGQWTKASGTAKGTRERRGCSDCDDGRSSSGAGCSMGDGQRSAECARAATTAGVRDGRRWHRCWVTGSSAGLTRPDRPDRPDRPGHC